MASAPPNGVPALEQIRHFVLHDAEAGWPQVRDTDEVPAELFGAATSLGLQRLTIPAEYGGFGLAMPDYQPYLELTGQGPGWLRMLTHVGNGFWRPLARFGSDEQRALVRSMAHGETFVAFALTEPEGGTGRDLRSRAVQEGDHWRVTGTKHLITFADRADYFLLTVASDDRRAADSLTTFCVPRDSAGLTVDVGQHTMGLAGTGHGILRYDDMIVPDRYRLGEVGEGLTVGMSFLDYSRVSLATCMVGVAQRALDEAVSHARRRHTFGKPLAARQAVQVHLAQMETDVAAGRALVRDVGLLQATGGDLTAAAATAKLFCQQMVGRVTDHALQVSGGVGYTTDSVVERLYRDARGFWFEEGTAEIQQLVIARELLREGG